MESATEERVPSDCNGVLMFSEQSSSCGSLCDLNSGVRKRRENEIISREGWTLYTRYI